MTEGSKVEDQLNQLDSNVIRIGSSIEALGVLVSTVCIPECPSAQSVCNEVSAINSPLVETLKDTNQRLCAFVQRVTDINERLEL